jgi:hypothetical protein
MTLTQRNAIASPGTGLLIYQTNSTPGFYYYTGSAWNPISSKGANTGLSNLTSPTAVNVNLFPDSNGLRSFGSSSLRWKEVNLNNLKFSDATTQTTAFVPYTAGTGISISGTTIANTKPDKTVVLNNGSGISITGIYPNFTVSSTLQQGWSLTGNAGTDPSTNFIGTTDAQSLVFKINNLRAGLIDNSTCCSGTHNTAFGQIALNSYTSGIDNTAMGYGVLYSNQAGSENSALGKYALFNNNANDNTAIGFNAMFFNTTGVNNTATGSVALQNNTTGQQNTANGFAALYSNNTGSYNTASGAYAMYLNTNSYYNTALGGNALYSNTLGASNTAVGYNSLYNNTANYNTAIGATALYANSTGTNNTATGVEALHFNSIGNDNTANGFDALLSNTSGINNTAIGSNALLSNDNGGDNTANGYKALGANSTGSYNTAVGAFALETLNSVNTTGVGYGTLSENTSGVDNTGIGFLALNHSTGSQNTAIGSGALQHQSGYGSGNGSTATGYLALKYNYGNYNTANGYEALVNATSGNNNTAFGTNAMISLTTGSNNISMGYAADITGTSTNSIAIGTNIQVDGDNTDFIGNSATTFLYGPIYVVASDGRFKKNIKENVPGLDFINVLRPVSYQYKSEDLQKHLAGHDSAMLAHVNQLNYKDAESKVHLGFIAQEVEKVMNEKGYAGNIVKKPASEQDNYGLAYDEFIPPMVRAIQQLSKENDSLKSINDKQQQQLNTIMSLLNNLQGQLNDLKIEQQQCCSSSSVVANKSTGITITDEASLQQNVPNPFTNTTTINYTLPQSRMGKTNAQIMITDKSGKTLKAINISGSGKGNLKVDAVTLASGAYQYSLMIDGRLIDTKQMEHIK